MTATPHRVWGSTPTNSGLCPSVLIPLAWRSQAWTACPRDRLPNGTRASVRGGRLAVANPRLPCCVSHSVGLCPARCCGGAVTVGS